LLTNENTRQAEKLPGGFCEYCGAPGYTEEHHIKTRGSGGPDIAENKIRLCIACHRLAQEYKIDRLELVQIVAEREGLAPEEVCLRAGIPVPDEFPPAREKKEPPSLEELIQAYINLDERQDECNFLKGQLLAAMLEAGVKKGWIASQVRASVSQIKVLVRTYRAFPDEGMRIPELTWYHHRLAAYTDDPKKWIERAADEGWSTRELSRAIKEEENPALASGEEEKEMKAARSAFKKVEEILSKGGPAAKWLKESLREAICR